MIKRTRNNLWLFGGGGEQEGEREKTETLSSKEQVEIKLGLLGHH